MEGSAPYHSTGETPQTGVRSISALFNAFTVIKQVLWPLGFLIFDVVERGRAHWSSALTLRFPYLCGAMAHGVACANASIRLGPVEAAFRIPNDAPVWILALAHPLPILYGVNGQTSTQVGNLTP
jgi:hypothetical protein